MWRSRMCSCTPACVCVWVCVFVLVFVWLGVCGVCVCVCLHVCVHTLLRTTPTMTPVLPEEELEVELLGGWPVMLDGGGTQQGTPARVCVGACVYMCVCARGAAGVLGGVRRTDAEKHFRTRGRWQRHRRGNCRLPSKTFSRTLPSTHKLARPQEEMGTADRYSKCCRRDFSCPCGVHTNIPESCQGSPWGGPSRAQSARR